MGKNGKAVKKKRYRVQITLSVLQYEQFVTAFKHTPYTTMTDYARKLLLGKPVRTYYRDRAFDEFTEAAIGFRKDARLMLQRPDWSEEEKSWMKEKFEKMEQLHIKIHEHVRQNNSNQKRPENGDL